MVVVWCALVGCLLAGCSTYRDVVPGELQIAGYTGDAITPDKDLRLRSPGGTDLTFHNAKFESKSFELPPYWGIRGTYFLPKNPRWGFAIDYTHAKLYMDEDQIVNVSGTRNGVPVNGSQPIRNDIDGFELTNGLNYLTANVVHRWFPRCQRDCSFVGRLQPYVGLGAGIAIPHVETTINGTRVHEYQEVGPTVGGFVGTHVDLSQAFGAFLEYKVNYGKLDIDVGGGSRLELEPWTHALNVGLTLKL